LALTRGQRQSLATNSTDFEATDSMAALPFSALQQRQHKQGHAALVPRSAGQLKAEHDGIVGRAQFFLYATIALAIAGVMADGVGVFGPGGPPGCACGFGAVRYG